jgi:phosphohistidine phosphatase
MKRLWLLRHASAEGGAPDEQRRLTARGQAEAERVAERWGDAASAPELVLCSPARRARATAEIVTAPLEPSPRRELDESLYLATPGAILKAIGAVPAGCSALLVVGHNPGLADFAADLSSAGGTAARALRHFGFPPAALASFELEIEDWAEVEGARARLVEFATPRLLVGPEAPGRA